MSDIVALSLIPPITMTLGPRLKYIISRLQEAGIGEAALEAELILMHLLGVDRVRLFLHDRDLNTLEAANLEELLRRRIAREPLAYILGETEFWSLPFYVSPAVLIPRPETELLIEQALEKLREIDEAAALILDMGVGSGVISIVLALEAPLAQVVGLDLSSAAIKIARRNAKRHRVDDRVKFIESDWFAGLSENNKFDLIVTNPPYVAAEIKDTLQPELAFEPDMALFGGTNGTEAISRFAGRIAAHLKPGGWVCMEIGADQQKFMLDLFGSLHDYDRLKVIKDYAGHPRIMLARLK